MERGRVTHLAIWLCLAFLACSRNDVERVSAPSVPSPTSESATGSTEFIADPVGTKPTFHEAIDEITLEVKEKKLRDASIGGDDIEVRVWGGFGITTLSAFFVRKTNGRWSANKIVTDLTETSRSKYREIQLSEPTTGWDQAWKQLLENDLLTLPDSDTIKCSPMIEDGYSYVIEVRKGSDYRTYAYENPEFDFEGRCSEADKMLKIIDIINRQYGPVGFPRTNG